MRNRKDEFGDEFDDLKKHASDFQKAFTMKKGKSVFKGMWKGKG